MIKAAKPAAARPAPTAPAPASDDGRLKLQAFAGARPGDLSGSPEPDKSPTSLSWRASLSPNRTQFGGKRAGGARRVNWELRALGGVDFELASARD